MAARKPATTRLTTPPFPDPAAVKAMATEHKELLESVLAYNFQRTVSDHVSSLAKSAVQGPTTLRVTLRPPPREAGRLFAPHTMSVDFVQASRAYKALAKTLGTYGMKGVSVARVSQGEIMIGVQRIDC